jgi:ABC-2 type transport system permease protein
MTQIKAGLKKEWLYFTRSFRFWGTVIAFAGCALLYPLMAQLMQSTSEMMTQLSEQGMQGMEELDAVDAMASMFTLPMTYAGAILSIASTASIVVLILLAGTAGGEQKKRSIVLPQTAGLTPAGYVLPKFMLFPPLMFVLTLAAAFLANGATHLVFKDSFAVETVLLTGSLVGVFMMFLVCLYLFLGISLTQPGLSVIYVLGANMIIEPMLMYVFDIDRFTPWNLGGMASVIVMTSRGTVASSAIVGTVLITLALCVVFMLLTLFAAVAKRTDNTADEVY